MNRLLVVFLLFNLSTFLITSHCHNPPPPVHPKPHASHNPPPPVHPKPHASHNPPPPVHPKPHASHNPPPPVHPKPHASKSPCPPPPPAMDPLTCPIDALRLGVCVDVLWGLVHFGIGGAAKYACCPVLDGMVGLDAALCLCESINLKFFNISILFPFALDVLVNECGKQPPHGFQCLA